MGLSGVPGGAGARGARGVGAWRERVGVRIGRIAVACVAVVGALGGAAAVAAQSVDPLGELVREGLRRNLALEQQRLLLERGEAELAEARGLFLPSVSLDVRHSESRGVLDLGELVNPAYQALNQLTQSSAFPTDVEARLPLRQETKLRVTQPLYSPAVVANRRLRRTLRDVREAELHAGVRQLAAEIQTAYLRYASALRVEELYRGTLPLLEENVRVNERLVTAGRHTPDAVFRARAERSETEQMLADARLRRSAAARHLNLLLGRPLDATIEVVADSLLDFPLELTRDEAVGRARSRREEVRQAELGVDAARAQGRLARAGFLPSLAVAVDYGIQGSAYRFDAEHDFVIASVVLQWNLFNGGQDAARRQQASLETRRARARQEELDRQIVLHVEQAYEAAVVARRAIATAEDRLASARRTFELVSRRYENGAAAQIEYLDARTAYTNAELNLILTRYAYAARWVELEHAAALRDD
jgi:outer membrane protein TolC